MKRKKIRIKLNLKSKGIKVQRINRTRRKMERGKRKNLRENTKGRKKKIMLKNIRTKEDNFKKKENSN